MKKYFLLLAQINGLGPKTLLSLEAHFSDLSDCFKLSLTELKALGLSDNVINQIRNPNWSLIGHWWKKHLLGQPLKDKHF